MLPSELCYYNVSPSLVKIGLTSQRVMCFMHPKIANEANSGSEDTGALGTKVELGVLRRSSSGTAASEWHF